MMRASIEDENKMEDWTVINHRIATTKTVGGVE